MVSWAAFIGGDSSIPERCWRAFRLLAVAPPDEKPTPNRAGPRFPSATRANRTGTLGITGTPGLRGHHTDLRLHRDYGDTTPISDFNSARSSNPGTINPVGLGPVLAFGDSAKDQSVVCFFVLVQENPVAAATLHKPSRRCGPNFTETLLPIDYQGRQFGTFC